MENQTSYSTSDIYIASALIQLTGIKPSFKKVCDAKRIYVCMTWSDRELLRPYIDDISSISVKVLEFKEIHYETKMTCLSMIREGKQ